jgi:hypothetical protein
MGSIGPTITLRTEATLSRTISTAIRRGLVSMMFLRARGTISKAKQR